MKIEVMPRLMEEIASGNFQPGAGGGAWVAGSTPRGFTSFVRNAAGDYSFTLDNGGCDSTQCVIIVTRIDAHAGSTNCSAGTVHTSDTVKQILFLREAALGGASVLSDTAAWSISVYRVL